MPTRYDSEDDSRDSDRGDREISLDTGTVLGIFLALALVCSLFFGLGYSMGRRSVPLLATASAAPSTQSSTSPQSSNGDEKPSPGRPSGVRELPSSSFSRPDSQVVQPSQQSSRIRDSSPSAEMPGERPSRPGSRDGATANTELRAALPPVPSSTSPDSPGGAQSFVQIAAVSRKEDADLLLAALKKRGYAGIIRPRTLDNLLHVQVGPFPTKKDAEAMRQRLIVDGYNPILK